MTSPENIGQQFTCRQCGEPINNHPSDGKHGANMMFEEFKAKVGDGDTPSDLISAVNNAARTQRVNLGNRKELINHLESVHGHGLIDDVGAGSVEYRDAYDHMDVPGIDWNSSKEKLTTPELQTLHDHLHKIGGIPHLTNGNEHYHLGE
jgi:hypothetical protein